MVLEVFFAELEAACRCIAHVTLLASGCVRSPQDYETSRSFSQPLLGFNIYPRGTVERSTRRILGETKVRTNRRPNAEWISRAHFTSSICF